jgi:putative peptide zinc metalloprotease protein
MSTMTIGDTSAIPFARRDLEILPVEYQGQPYWTIKDPIALRYFQLREEEHFILCLLDGRCVQERLSLDEIIARFEQRFAPRRLRRTELAGFLTMLHREGLVASAAPGQGEQLLIRDRTRRWQGRLSALGNVLAIRLPGINPDRILSAIIPRLEWLFSPACLVTALLLIGVAATVALVNSRELIARLPRLTEFFGPGNLLWLAVSLAIVKSLHELGHAVTCKHFGGECHRLGIMLLVFTPALYCDVSDAWMFPNRWRRIAVSAAGVAVELVLAAAATLVWSMTQPGWINSLSLNVMVVCSVSTLLINGNPLLRYDGYYVLADWLGTPNLQQQASAALRRSAAWLLAGVELDQPRYLAEPRPVVLWSYAIAATIYRAFVMVAVLLVIDAALRPHGLSAVSLLIGLLVLASIAAGPVARTAGFLRRPALRKQVKGRWLLTSTLLLAAIIALVLAVPLPARISAPAITRPVDGRQVFVTTPGVLTAASAAGRHVAAGERIAQLANHKLELEIAELASREAQQRLQVEHLALRQHHDSTLADQLPAAEKRLSDLTQQLAQRRRDYARLAVVSPIDGTVLPPPKRAAESPGDELTTFTGTPLDPQNLGCYLEAGTLLGTIADPQRQEALAMVAESDIQGLREGQSVRIAFSQLPGQVWRGRVREISRLRSDELPPQMIADRMIPLEAGPDGRAHPAQKCFQVAVELEPRESVSLVGAIGWARIEIDPQPLGLRLYRALRGTLRTPW